MNAPLQIKLEYDNKIIRTELCTIFYPAIVHIILSYHTTSWHWLHVENREKEEAHIIMNNEVISFKKIPILNIFRFESCGVISTNTTIYKLFCDAPYIYVLHTESISVLHYCNKKINNLIIQSNTVDNGKIIQLILQIKNKTIYTSKLDYFCSDSPNIHCDDGISYSIRNINIFFHIVYRQLSTCMTDSFPFYDLCYIDNIFVNDKNEIAVSILNSRVGSCEFSRLKLDDEYIWCICNGGLSRILYNDDYEIMCTSPSYECKIVCYDKLDGQMCVHHFDTICKNMYANKELLIFTSKDRLHVYKIKE